MTHLHEMHDTDTHFKIDPITRQIINKSEKTKLVQGDHNSEIYTFDIPAIIEGHNMIDCNRIEVHFTNKPRKGSEVSEDVYIVEDAKTVDYNLVFSWEVGRKATKYAGGLSFLIKFLCIEEDGAITYEWNTETFDGIEVAAGKNNTEQIVEESYDILSQFGKVKTVNGAEPDENGNVEVEIPEVTWESLPDKPFSSEVTYTDTLTWDGNTDGLENAGVIGEDEMYRVSSATATFEDFASGFYMQGDDGNLFYDQNDMNDMNGLGFMCANQIIVVYEDNTNPEDPSMTIKKGVYLRYDVRSVTLTNGKFKMEDVKTIDPKYLPEANKEIVVARIMVEQNSYNVSPLDPRFASVDDIKWAIENRVPVVLISEFSTYNGILPFVGISEQDGMTLCVFAGITCDIFNTNIMEDRYDAISIPMFAVALDGDMRGAVLNMDQISFSQLNKNLIAEEGNNYMAGTYTFFKDSMIIKSSTEGSNKKFKITVDDNGTIAATEC